MTYEEVLKLIEHQIDKDNRIRCKTDWYINNIWFSIDEKSRLCFDFATIDNYALTFFKNGCCVIAVLINNIKTFTVW